MAANWSCFYKATSVACSKLMIKQYSIDKIIAALPVYVFIKTYPIAKSSLLELGGQKVK